MLSENCYKWVSASIFEYFNTNKGTLNLRTEDQPLEDRDASVEIRLGEPKFIQIGKNQHIISININILVYTPKSKTDLYAHRKQVGKIQSLIKDIPIYKYGDGDSYYFCLQASNVTRTVPLGQVEEALRAEQTAVENTYTGMFED